jgi:ABC-type branched-subunit amino acid transport system ATPase component
MADALIQLKGGERQQLAIAQPLAGGGLDQWLF